MTTLAAKAAIPETPVSKHKAEHKSARPALPAAMAPLFSVPMIQRKAACACGGGCPNCEAEKNRFLQAKLKVGAHDDHYEQEADRVAERVMREPREISSTVAPPSLQAKERVPSSHKTAGHVPEMSSFGSGAPLSHATRAYFEPRFGADLSGVRVHTNPSAASTAAAINARAFTVGSDIVFGDGEYAPDTDTGRHLLAHELTHVGQQGNLERPHIQRTTHDSTTPTNCHNWKIPLPPWIAGTIAHGQIGALMGIPARGIPRATKLLMGFPNPPAIAPMGFADLWQNAGTVNIAEIKSTQTGSTVAQAEAAHYILRHTEWLTRAPWTGDSVDLAYAAQVAGSKPGVPLDLSGRTGTGLSLGPFWGDPLKELFCEGDALGAVVYWCTGAGLPGSPVWLPLFREAVRRLREMLLQAQRAVEEALDWIGETATGAYDAVARAVQQAIDWVAVHSRVLAFILILLLLIIGIVLLIISILAEPASGGTSTIPAFGSAAVIVVSFTSLMTMLGAGSPGLAPATATLAASLQPGAETRGATSEEYERGGGSVTSQQGAQTLVNAPVATLTASLSQLADPLALARNAVSNRSSVSASDIAQLQSAATALSNAGDTATATRARNLMRAAGLG
jgi:hypothetical protein